MVGVVGGIGERHDASANRGHPLRAIVQRGSPGRTGCRRTLHYAHVRPRDPRIQCVKMAKFSGLAISVVFPSDVNEWHRILQPLPGLFPKLWRRRYRCCPNSAFQEQSEVRALARTNRFFLTRASAPEASGVKTPSRSKHFVGAEAPTSENRMRFKLGQYQPKGRLPTGPRACASRNNNAYFPFDAEVTFTFTWRGLDSSRLGRLTVNTPFLYSARMASGFTVFGNEKLRLKVP